MTARPLRTSWFTFSFDHVHRVYGRTFDCDTIVKITAPDPRARMLALFGNEWFWEHDEPPSFASEPGVKVVELA